MPSYVFRRAVRADPARPLRPVCSGYYSPPSPGVNPDVIGVAVHVHSRTGDDLGVAHVPPPVRVGDVFELGNGPILLLRVVDLAETGPHSSLAALVKVSCADGRPLDEFASYCGSRSASRRRVGCTN